MASGDSHATSVRILNENVDKLIKLPDMVKAFDELTNEEVTLLWLLVVCSVVKCVVPSTGFLPFSCTFLGQYVA